MFVETPIVPKQFLLFSAWALVSDGIPHLSGSRELNSSIDFRSNMSMTEVFFCVEDGESMLWIYGTNTSLP